MIQSNDLNVSELEIYISYQNLSVEAFADLLTTFARISNYKLNQIAEFRHLKISELPKLDIDSINTGNSIKFTFGEGWLPSITSNEENDIVIQTPKKLGIPLLVGYIFLSGFQMIQDVKNKNLDNQIKEIDLKLKQIELEEKIKRKDDLTTSEATKGIERIRNNPDIQQFIIYDIDILNLEQPENPEEPTANRR